MIGHLGRSEGFGAWESGGFGFSVLPESEVAGVWAKLSVYV